MFATFAVDSDDADHFWHSVATGVGFESEDEPASRLRQMLKNANLSGGMQQRGSKGMLGAEDMYRGCLHAWNRYRKGGDFKTVLRPTAYVARPELK
jgi:hypothetical protein